MVGSPENGGPKRLVGRPTAGPDGGAGGSKAYRFFKMVGKWWGFAANGLPGKSKARRNLLSRRAFRQAGELGFEPRLTDPESVVLPLHHSPSPSPTRTYDSRCLPRPTDFSLILAGFLAPSS